MDGNDIRRIAPLCKDPWPVAKALEAAFEKYGINTPLRKAAFVAQCAHESASFNALEENLNYGATALATVWPGRFAENPQSSGPKVPNWQAISIARKPIQIANIVYANRMGNGATVSGDGWRFRGGGYMGLTGKANYAAYGHADDPEYVRTPDGAADSAGWFWKTNNLNRFADASDFTGLTRAINGGLVGMEDRLFFYGRAKLFFGA